MDVTGIMSENVIIADASYLDKVAFDLTVNFERMLERRIQKADLCRWLDCVALDGGIEPGDNKIQVIFIYDGNGGQLDNFNPSNLEKDINGMAFKDNLGEFMMAAYPVAKDVTDMGRFFVETLKVTGDCKETKNIMVVADIEKYGMEMLKAGTDIDNMSADEIVKNDMKEFLISHYRISISQCSVMDKMQAENRKDEILAAAEEMRKREGYNLSIIMITNILEEASILIFSGEPKSLVGEAFKVDTSLRMVTLPGVMSRKKQVVPPLSEAAKLIRSDNDF